MFIVLSVSPSRLPGMTLALCVCSSAATPLRELAGAVVVLLVVVEVLVGLVLVISLLVVDLEDELSRVFVAVLGSSEGIAVAQTAVVLVVLRIPVLKAKVPLVSLARRWVDMSLVVSLVEVCSAFREA